jgi:hypothetical protein
MRIFLFLVVNALLFIRPSELIAELHAVELYRYAILACLLVSFPAVWQQCALRIPGVPPILACVVLLLPAVFLSGAFHGNLDLIMDTVSGFAKTLIYFLLMVALLTDTARLRQFLYALGVFSAILTLAAVVRYHADVAVPSSRAPEQTAGKKKNDTAYVVDEVRDTQTGQVSQVQRMCGTGIFGDPNDLALVLVTAIPLGLYWLTDAGQKFTRPLWLAAILLSGYALMLTHSRGGFLALLAGLGTVFYLRFGAIRTLLAGALVLPVLLALFAGRMTTISTDETTGQSRIQLWSEAFVYFRYSPLFGIGMDNYHMYSKLIAHNSFLHCYAELGLFGGSLFLGAFYMAIRGILELRRQPGMQGAEQGESSLPDAELTRLYPYLAGMLIAYTVGICFLSRSYMVPTYTLLGLAVVYLRLYGTQARQPIATWTRGVWPRLAGVSCTFLIGAYTFVRIFAH